MIDVENLHTTHEQLMKKYKLSMGIFVPILQRTRYILRYGLEYNQEKGI
jgi:hypothetical protein